MMSYPAEIQRAAVWRYFLAKTAPAADIVC
jgi:hypothetical protein